MDCPVCDRSAMITLELSDVEVDYCPSCQGIWLDGGELEMLLGDSQASAELLASLRVADSREASRQCPICDKPMGKVLAGPQESHVLIDSCRQGDGLWFDKGELRQVLELGTLDSDRRVLDLLADMFGEKTTRE